MKKWHNWLSSLGGSNRTEIQLVEIIIWHTRDEKIERKTKHSQGSKSAQGLEEGAQIAPSIIENYGFESVENNFEQWTRVEGV